ncbi:MAG: hypothetical protein LBI87_14175 [Candidatus Accumulibacter sp.]|nr:hypothetical protein [Accumulibacter sp.]
MQPIDMRRRIRELQSIPERDRTDAEWDELNELEIRTAPGNRDYDRTQDRQIDRRPGVLMGQGKRPERNGKPQGNKNGNLLRPPSEGRPEGGGRLLKRQHRRPKRLGDAPPGIGMPDASLSPIIIEIPAIDDGSES